MHILFIGGTGLISTAIVGKLLGRGDKVTCFNRGKSASRLPEHPNLEIVTGDRQDRPGFEAAFADRTFDAVIDMISFHPDDAASAIRAFSGKTRQFVHCSTVCVYSGPPHTIPTPETEPYHSIGGYGKNKAAIEELLLAEHAKSGFPVTILRPSHSYGEGGNILRPWGPGGDGWARFLDRLRKGKPVVVPGDGTGLWASCHVEDVAEGFISVLGKPEALGQCFNITGEQNMTWNTYHEQVAEVVGGTFHPVYIPTDILCEVAPSWSGGLKEIFAYPSIFDNAKIKAVGYPGQTISLKEGTARTLAWMEANDRLRDESGDGGYEDRLIAAWRTGIHSLPSAE
jgi:nucleoside-diphosphate-sugar epimerase